jgi:Protein of unknown function (DUF3429)
MKESARMDLENAGSGLPSTSAAALPPGTDALGYGGLLPFALLTAALWLLDPGQRLHALALTGLLAYGAVILSFLGAVHWGFVLSRPTARAPMLLALGVVPALLGAVTLAMRPETALVTQMIAFGAVWLYEHRVVGVELLGKPYLDLRRTLTVGVLGIQLLALFGPVARLGG